MYKKKKKRREVPNRKVESDVYEMRILNFFKKIVESFRDYDKRKCIFKYFPYLHLFNILKIAIQFYLFYLKNYKIIYYFVPSLALLYYL